MDAWPHGRIGQDDIDSFCFVSVPGVSVHFVSGSYRFLALAFRVVSGIERFVLVPFCVFPVVFRSRFFPVPFLLFPLFSVICVSVLSSSGSF